MTDLIKLWNQKKPKSDYFNYMRICKRCGEHKQVIGKRSKICKECVSKTILGRSKVKSDE